MEKDKLIHMVSDKIKLKSKPYNKEASLTAVNKDLRRRINKTIRVLECITYDSIEKFGLDDIDYAIYILKGSKNEKSS